MKGRRASSTLLAVLLVAAIGVGLAFRPSASSRARPNIILICVDGCAPDHLGLYGYPLNTSPNIDRLGRQGLVFEHNYAQANESLFSHASIFSGLYASEIGPVDYMHFAIRDDLATLPNILKTYGYRTGAFTGGGHITHEYGFDHGFEVYYDKKFFGTFYDSVPQALMWMEQHRDEPRFVFLHGYDCHRPYRKPGVFDHLYAENVKSEADRFLSSNRLLDRIYNGVYYPDFALRSTWTWTGARPIDPRNYLELARGSESGTLKGQPLSEADVKHIVSHFDGAVSYADTWLGDFFAHLRALGLDESNTLIVLLADHGEDLMQHGVFNHRIGLQTSNIQVPLIFWGAGVSPKVRGTRVDAVTENVDVLPTVLGLLDLPVPSGVRGRSLVDLLSGRVRNDSLTTAMKERAAYSEGILGMISLVDARSHVIVRGALPASDEMLERMQDEVNQREHIEFFDLGADPREQRNLAADPQRKGDVSAAVHRLYELEKDVTAVATRRNGGVKVDNHIDPALQEKLRRHGYW